MPEATSGAASQGPDRAAILAEMATLPDDGTAATPVKPAPDKQASTPAEVEAPDQEAAPDVATDAPDAETTEQPDAETQKRLDMVTRAEKRSRQQLTKERQDFEAERREHVDAQRAHKAEVESFTRSKTTARKDVVSHLRGLGFQEEDFALAAQQMYLQTKGAAADPQRKAAVTAETEKRELRDEIAELRAWRDEQEQAKQKHAVEQTQSQRAEAYANTMLAQVNETSTPLVHRQFSKSPQKAIEGLVKTYDALVAEFDDVPDHADVVKAYEKRRRVELEEEGVDVDTLIGKKAAPVVAKPAGRTLGSGNAAGATRPKPGTPKRLPNGHLAPESRDEILGEMKSLADDAS